MARSGPLPLTIRSSASQAILFTGFKPLASLKGRKLKDHINQYIEFGNEQLSNKYEQYYNNI